ncbi:blast:RNA polymerase-associated protein Rtf1 [Drosophila guanche]|uniref:Blast:RNA polymerase-associated protein Rtf1 n=1 Tax=Drosophila guanche TaxID=7266 RepID=A0A3B0K5Z2_DROGU|nr:blast:RNA polymerase-associated protein Rtf1 [Drosophila guanche]
MSAEVDLDDFESWMAMQGPEADALGGADTAETTESISQQLKEEQETIEERSEIPAKPDDNFEPWKMTEFDDPTQMSLEQLEEIQQIYLRRLAHEDLEDGECLDKEALAGKSARSLVVRIWRYSGQSTIAPLPCSVGSPNECTNSQRNRMKAANASKTESLSGCLMANEIELEELHKVVLTRSQLTDFVDKPIFEETVIDCFIHMPGENLQATVYRITSVVKAKQPYQLSNKLTHYMLRLRHGRFDRSARLDTICNNPVEPEAFQNWIANCEKDNCLLPELSLLTKKLQDITKATNYQFSEDDVAAIIKKKRESGRRKEKITGLNIRLIEQRDLALSNNNQEEVARLESEIEEIDRDQKKHSFGYSGVQKGLRFGGSLRSGLKPYVLKMTVPESQHRHEAALQMVMLIVIYRMVKFLLAMPQLRIYRDYYKSLTKPKLLGVKAAVARLLKTVAAKRSLSEISPKPENVELERFTKRKCKKSSTGIPSRESGADLLKVEEVQQKTKSSIPYELHNFHVDIDMSGLGG